MNEVICHGIPDSRPLEEGDIISKIFEFVLLYTNIFITGRYICTYYEILFVNKPPLKRG